MDRAGIGVVTETISSGLKCLVEPGVTFDAVFVDFGVTDPLDTCSAAQYRRENKSM